MTLAPGTRFGSWIVLSVSGRSATCACACGTVRVLSVNAIASGEATMSCGCVALTWQERYEAKRADDASKATRDLRDWRGGR